MYRFCRQQKDLHIYKSIVKQIDYKKYRLRASHLLQSLHMDDMDNPGPVDSVLLFKVKFKRFSACEISEAHFLTLYMTVTQFASLSCKELENHFHNYTISTTAPLPPLCHCIPQTCFHCTYYIFQSGYIFAVVIFIAPD